MSRRLKMVSAGTYSLSVFGRLTFIPALVIATVVKNLTLLPTDSYVLLSPSSHLPDRIKSRVDLEDGDSRHLFDRFQDDVRACAVCAPASLADTAARPRILDTQPVDALSTLAHRKGITLARLCIVWVSAFGDHVIPLLGSS